MQIARPVAVGKTGVALGAREDDRLVRNHDQIRQIGDLLHRVGAARDHHAGDTRVPEQLIGPLGDAERQFKREQETAKVTELLGHDIHS